MDSQECLSHSATSADSKELELVLNDNDIARLDVLQNQVTGSCLVCFDDLSPDNALAFKAKRDSEWALSMFCIDCVDHLIAHQQQYHRYRHSLATTTCAKEQRALLSRGPPVNVYDRLGFPETESEEIFSLYDFGGKSIKSPKLEGSVTGEERLKLWEELKKFKFQGDKDDDE